ncbi:hypothetical protein C2G38_2176880 [Gigaspora rosea]|uniref:Uncharacterized protein n=1 Tax=Gigaspora rosea TaxID=44941 RepID=A0A397VH93_9GLOM|nr:hypothetical protein C2G38_2176880 [Gigaspora rosea]
MSNLEYSAYYKKLQGYLISNYFDLIKLLTIYSYMNNIEECKEECSIKGLQLLEFKNRIYIQY